tara:strand:- start:43 stop:405 length:363 start_codon:yes stop_codon:yes gene_type:complete
VIAAATYPAAQAAQLLSVVVVAAIDALAVSPLNVVLPQVGVVTGAQFSMGRAANVPTAQSSQLLSAVVLLTVARVVDPEIVVLPQVGVVTAAQLVASLAPNVEPLLHGAHEESTVADPAV